MDFMNEINAKYIELEAEADKILEKAKREEEKLLKLEAKNADRLASSQQTPKLLSYEEARARNANLLKAIDMAKARLRSRSTFSPVEQILEKAIENYKRDIHSTLATTFGPRRNQSTEMYQIDDCDENVYETLQ